MVLLVIWNIWGDAESWSEATLESLVLEDGGHAVPFNQENRFGRQQLWLFQLPSPSRCCYGTRIASEGFSGTQSVRWKSERENHSLSGIHIFSATQATRPVANKYLPPHKQISEGDLKLGLLKGLCSIRLSLVFRYLELLWSSHNLVC